GPAGDAAAPGSPARSLDGDLSHRAPAVAVDLVGDDLRRRGEVLRELLLHRLEVRGVHVRARTLVGERLDEHVGVRVLHAAGPLEPQVPGLGQGGLGELARDLGPLGGERGLHGERHVDEAHRPVRSGGAAPACPEAAERGSPILARQEPAPHQGPCGTMRAAAERGAMSIVEERGEEAPAGQIARALAVLEAVAEHGSSTACGIADATGIPLPTVYRIAQRSPPSSPTRPSGASIVGGGTRCSARARSAASPPPRPPATPRPAWRWERCWPWACPSPRPPRSCSPPSGSTASSPARCCSRTARTSSGPCWRASSSPWWCC